MIVHDLDVRRSLVGPAKAKAVLVIDTNTELSFAITLQRFQSIARRRAQKFKGLCCIELSQFPSRDFNNCRKSLAPTIPVVPLEGMETCEFKDLSQLNSANRGTIMGS